MAVPESNNKVNVSIGLIMAIVAASFTLGGLVTGVLGLDGKIVDEVGGLRKDVERENILLREEIKRVEDKIGRKVGNHEAIFHK